MEEPDYYGLLATADESPSGIAVSTNNPKLVRNKLYAIRRETGLYLNISFVIPPEPDTLWLVKKDGVNGTE